MASFTDFGRQQADLILAKGQAQAQGIAQRGQALGSTIATLGSVIPQQVQQAIKKAAEDRKEKQIRQIFAQHGSDLPTAIDKIMAIDPALGLKLGEQYGQAQKTAAEITKMQQEHEDKMRAFEQNVLGSATDADSYAQGLITLKLAGRDISQYPTEWNPSIAKQANRQGMTPQQRTQADTPEFIARNPEYDVVNKNTGEVVTPGTPPPPKPANAPNVGSFEDYVLRTYGPNPTSAQILEGRKKFNQADDRPISVTVPGGSASDPKDIAAAIISGDQPPTLQGLYRLGAPVRAELARKGYDLSQAQTDWQAMQRFTATLNGAQQTRLRQATEFVKETVPLVRDLSADLAKKLPRGQFPILNSVALNAAKNGGLGPEAQAAATTLAAQIADMQSELAVMYRGGNASTDEALKKAGEMLKANWSAPQLEAALKLIEKNATIRLNSIRNTGVANVGGADNRYAPPAPAAAPPPPAPTSGAKPNDPMGIR